MYLLLAKTLKFGNQTHSKGFDKKSSSNQSAGTNNVNNILKIIQPFPIQVPNNNLVKYMRTSKWGEVRGAYSRSTIIVDAKIKNKRLKRKTTTFIWWS